MSTENLLSICVPVYSRIDLISRCVESIRDNTSGQYELVLVNDGSPEGEMRHYIHREADVSILNDQNEGIAFSRAKAVEESSGEWIAMLDSDVVLTPGWDAKLLAAFERWDDPHAEVVMAAALLTCQIGYFLHQAKSMNSFGLIQVGIVGTACTIFRRSLVDVIGNFDPELYNLWSDLDFCKRIERDVDKFERSPKVVIDPRTVAYHHGWTDPETGEMQEQTDANSRSLPELNDMAHKKRHLNSMQLINERWGIKHPNMENLAAEVGSHYA